MTCKEKLQMEHPESVGDQFWGGCEECPNDYDYMEAPMWCVADPEVCARCWDREIPETGNHDAASHDMVNHPTHYCREGGMECIEEMILLFGVEAVMSFCKCNAWKYRYRSSAKNGDEDLKKSDWYIRKYEELSGRGKSFR